MATSQTPDGSEMLQSLLNRDDTTQINHAHDAHIDNDPVVGVIAFNHNTSDVPTTYAYVTHSGTINHVPTRRSHRVIERATALSVVGEPYACGSCGGHTRRRDWQDEYTREIRCTECGEIADVQVVGVQ